MRNAKFFRLHLPLLNLTLLLLATSFLATGCGKDTPSTKAPPKTPSKAPSTAVPTAKAPAADVPAPADPFAETDPVVPATLPIQRAIDAVGVLLSGDKELEPVITGAQAKSTAKDQLPARAAEVYKQASESELVLGDGFIEITPPAPFKHDQYLTADLQLAVPLTAEQRDGTTSRNVGVLHLTTNGMVVVDGYYDKARSAVVVEVSHLSGFFSFRRDPLNEITKAILDEASQRAWAQVEETRKKLEEDLIKSAEDYLSKQAFDKLEGGLKRKILTGLITHRDTVGGLFAASGRRDPAGFCQSFQILMGKIIVDNVPASDLRDLLATVTDSTDAIAVVAQASGQAAGGDYWAAVEILGKAYSQTTPIYQYTVKAAAIMDAGWSMLKDDALEVFYEEYKADTFVPERITRREDILMYLKRKFPKAKNQRMTDGEVVKFVLDNFEKRKAHEKETAVWKAKLERIHAWYSSRPLIKSAIRERFNKPNDPDCFRRFLRVLDAVNNRLMRMGIYRSPWTAGGRYLPQPEVVELVNAFKRGGAAEFHRVVKEIERRLARPLDLSGYSGFWTLVDSKRTVLSTRKPNSDAQYRLEAAVEREGPHAYVGSVKLTDVISKSRPGSDKAEIIEFTYNADAKITFDNPPAVVPNGTNWEVALAMTIEEFCTSSVAEVHEEITYRLGSPTQLGGKGAPARHVDCSAAVISGARNRVRVRVTDDLVPTGPTQFNAGQGQPWKTPVPVRFTLIPETFKSTTEEFILILEARTPGGAFREDHTYTWSKDLPKKLEPELHREISRANFTGARSSKADMSAAATAKTAEPPKPTKTIAGSKTHITDLKYVPTKLVVKKEAAFEVKVENGPRVPSLAWSFGETTHTDSWTTVTQCKYTYYKPGTFTVTVRMRDKNNYAKGNLATASWQVTVVPDEDDTAPAGPTTATVAQGNQTPPDDKTDKPKDDTSPLQLTYPVGRSPKVFTKGWLFGAKCIVKGPDGKEIDLSDKVRWSGSGKFNPDIGNLSRPVFKSAGTNTITLTAEVNGKEITNSFKVEAIYPIGYACVGGQAFCPADTHGGPAGPMPVIGPIQSGSPTVLIGGKPAARVGDVGIHHACDGPNSFKIIAGEPSVLIEGRPAANIEKGVTEHCGGIGRIVSTGN